MTEKFILLLLLAIVPYTFTLHICPKTATTRITTSLGEFSSSTTLPTHSITKSPEEFSSLEFFRNHSKFSDITLHVSPTTTILQELPSTKDSKIVTTIHTSTVWHHNGFDNTLLNFKHLFVDKTTFIIEVTNHHAPFQLITRPSRWGKTFNMDMLKVFFDIAHDENGVIDEEKQKIRRLYFEGGIIMEKWNLHTTRPMRHDLKPLAVSKNSVAMQHLGHHPVIYLNLGNISESHSDFGRQLTGKIARLIKEKNYHKFLLPYCDLNILPEDVGSNYCKNLLQFPEETLCKDPDKLKHSLITLSALLREHFSSSVIILVDEYDYALNRQVNNKVKIDHTVACLKSLFTQTFKYGSHYLLYGIVTGVLQLSSGGISSGIAAARRYSIFVEKYATCFGFTEEEVQTLLKQNPNCSLSISDLRDWYNGYSFSGHRMYNPQSIIRAIDNGILGDYWVKSGSLGSKQTSDNLLSQVLFSDKYQPVYQKLYTNQEVMESLNPQVDFNTALIDRSEFLSTTTAFGFTASTKISKRLHLIMIPNMEVRGMFRHRIGQWGFMHVDRLKLEGIGLESVLYKMSEEFGKGNIEVVQSIFKNLLHSITQNITSDLLCNTIFGLFLTQDMNWYPNRTFYNFQASGPLKQNCIIMLKPQNPDNEVQIPISFFIAENISVTSDFPPTSYEKSTLEKPDMVKTQNMSSATELQDYLTTELQLCELGLDFVLDNLEIAWNVTKKGFRIAKNVTNKMVSCIVVLNRSVVKARSFLIPVANIIS